MDRRMQSDAYEPTVQVAQVGSTLKQVFILAFYSVIQFGESIRQTIFSPWNVFWEIILFWPWPLTLNYNKSASVHDDLL